jgi:hypothetical protein
MIVASDGGKIPFPQAAHLCHQKRVEQLSLWMPIVAAAAAAAAILVLALALRRREARIALLEAQNEALMDRAERLALLERREAACAPLDALWLCWTRCVPPGEETLSAASLAAESAKRLFPVDLEPDLDEVARLLTGLLRHRAWQHDAVLAGRHDERVALSEEAAGIERLLKPKLSALRTLLADAMRPQGWNRP